MTFGQAIQSAFKNYANFQGRATRSEFWWFQLFYLIVIIAIEILGGILGRNGIGIAMGALVLVGLGFFLPGLGLVIRRLHDTDRSGWWIFISMVPLVGGILLLVWYCTPGTPGPNKYGVGNLMANVANTFS